MVIFPSTCNSRYPNGWLSWLNPQNICVLLITVSLINRSNIMCYGIRDDNSRALRPNVDVFIPTGALVWICNGVAPASTNHEQAGVVWFPVSQSALSSIILSVPWPLPACTVTGIYGKVSGGGGGGGGDLRKGIWYLYGSHVSIF